MLEAERQFRRIIGYRDLADLAVAVEREIVRSRATSAHTEVRETITMGVAVALEARIPGKIASGAR